MPNDKSKKVFKKIIVTKLQELRKQSRTTLCIKENLKIRTNKHYFSTGLATDMEDLFWSPFKRYPVALSEFRTPSTDIADCDDRYEVCAEMPGIPKNDINIEVIPNSIEISAEHQESGEEKKKNWLRRERSSMSYCRCFDLPEEIKSDNVEAEFKDGILTVMLPKVKPKPEYKSKKVNIK